MKSVRFDPELEERLAEAARAEGVSPSAFIREAVRRLCDEGLERSLADELKALGVIGAVSGGVGDSRDSGRHFADLLAKRRERCSRIDLFSCCRPSSTVC